MFSLLEGKENMSEQTFSLLLAELLFIFIGFCIGVLVIKK